MFGENINLSWNSTWTSSDKVFYSLHNAILSLTLKPGYEIDISAVSERFGVSRSPVRNALTKLGEMGLVDIFPQKGSFVSRIDLFRVHEERYLRECLEKTTLELFCGNHSEADLNDLKANIKLQKEYIEKKDYSAFLDSDDAFHGIFFRGVGKNMCWQIVQNMSGHYRRIRLLTVIESKLVPGIISQHEDIVKNIEAKNVKEVLSLCSNHLSKLLVEENELLEKYPDYFLSPIPEIKGNYNIII